MKRTALGVMLGFLAACGPSFAPANAPTTPCPIIDEAAYAAARQAGAAWGEAQIREDGSVWLNNGPGIKHCATYNAPMKPCRRPNDYVIAYTQVDDTKFYVRVPAGADYRFNVHALPNTCQNVTPLQPPSAQ